MVAAKKNTVSPAQRKKILKNKQQQTANDEKGRRIVSNAKDREDVQYTLFVSGLRHGRFNEFEKINQTDNLAILFDSVERHTITRSYNKTSYAVESKAKASDHVVTQDGKISFSARITDSPYFIDKRNYIDRDTDKDRPMEAKRPGKAIEFLTRIADSHQVITLVTEDNILSNYVITNMTFDRSAEEGSGIAISMDLEEFRFKDVSRTVLARTTDPKKGGKKNSGTKQTANDGSADSDAKGKKKSPYLGKTSKAFERWETETVGTTNFDAKAGTKITPSGFDPKVLMRN